MTDAIKFLTDAIKNIIAFQLRLRAEDIPENAFIIEDLGADSLDIVEMISSVEEHFGIKIPDCEIENLRTVNQICGYISSVVDESADDESSCENELTCSI